MSDQIGSSSSDKLQNRRERNRLFMHKKREDPKYLETEAQRRRIARAALSQDRKVAIKEKDRAAHAQKRQQPSGATQNSSNSAPGHSGSTPTVVNALQRGKELSDQDRSVFARKRQLVATSNLTQPESSRSANDIIRAGEVCTIEFTANRDIPVEELLDALQLINQEDVNVNSGTSSGGAHILTPRVLQTGPSSFQQRHSPVSASPSAVLQFSPFCSSRLFAQSAPTPFAAVGPAQNTSFEVGIDESASPIYPSPPQSTEPFDL